MTPFLVRHKPLTERHLIGKFDIGVFLELRVKRGKSRQETSQRARHTTGLFIDSALIDFCDVQGDFLWRRRIAAWDASAFCSTWSSPRQRTRVASYNLHVGLLWEGGVFGHKNGTFVSERWRRPRVYVFGSQGIYPRSALGDLALGREHAVRA